MAFESFAELIWIRLALALLNKYEKGMKVNVRQWGKAFDVMYDWRRMKVSRMSQSEQYAIIEVVNSMLGSGLFHSNLIVQFYSIRHSNFQTKTEMSFHIETRRQNIS